MPRGFTSCGHCVCRQKLETLGDEIKEKFRGLEEEYR